MKFKIISLIFMGLASLHCTDAFGQTEDQKKLIDKISSYHKLTESQKKDLSIVFAGNNKTGQGNPKVTKNPVTRDQCEQQVKDKKIDYKISGAEELCGAPNMAPMYKKGEKAKDAKSCIDQFEFPNIPCEYPVVWVRADEAAKICTAMGKRLCDAHEWEGACDGDLQEPNYNFDLAKNEKASVAVGRMAKETNLREGKNKTWAYGAKEYQKGKCGANSTKDTKCNGGDWNNCGSNTYPTGYFAECKSPLGVYDQHGNAAEHMNLPLSKDQMASQGSTTLGHTEMKGSWFIFDKYKAHEDHCRWRAPYWHGTKVMDAKSHENYHLGFRCCKSLDVVKK